MWKQSTSSLWMNVTYFIFRLLHICNLLTLFVLTPLCLPCTPFVNCVHLFADYENTSGDYTNFSVDCAHNFDDYANVPNDWANTTVDSANTFDISSLDLSIPNPTLLQLLLIYRSKINIMFTARSIIYFSSSSFFIYGFCIWHSSLSSSMSKVTTWTPPTLYSQYIGICCFFLGTSNSMYL
jgi:hypothetical protein